MNILDIQADVGYTIWGRYIKMSDLKMLAIEAYSIQYWVDA